ncbi:MAG: helix-turn-helix domain-containing protein [Clostridia bacterium]|nr:helix-turn-helix domain-containing protein [Clostridia bacterium]
MSSRLFQGIIHQMKDAIGRTIGVIDENGVIIACSDLVKIGESRQNIRKEMTYISDIMVAGGYTYRPMSQSAGSEYIVFVEGEDVLAEKLSLILVVSLNNIKSYHDDKYDKTSFIKNIILDNILPGDIYVKSKELHFATDVLRVVFLLKFHPGTDISYYDVIMNMFPNTNQDYVISTSENDIVLVREVKPDSDVNDYKKTAKQIADTMMAEFLTKVSIGIGSAAESVKDVARSYREAQAALEVGHVFDTDKNIVSYENLGIGRLIYQLPTTMCEMFLDEVFQKESIEKLDQETLSTIQKFFENNLNVSETSRKMFVHRNTLVYRLEKIKKMTGLDLREFEDAITFKVALMVKRYLSSKPNKY